MQNENSFDLNHAVQRWRENLTASPSFRRENLDELESHLRDSIVTLQDRGLSADEAFLIAARRVGQSSVLETEFGKVNGSAIWLDRLFWMVVGYQVWLFISGAIGLVTRDALSFGLNGAGYDFKAHGYILPVTLFTLVNLAGFAGSLALCWWLFARKGQRLGQWLGRVLHNWTTWILTFGALYVLSLLVVFVDGGINVLLIKCFSPERIGELSLSQGYSGLLTKLITIAVFTWLTLFLARKRLCPHRA